MAYLESGEGTQAVMASGWVTNGDKVAAAGRAVDLLKQPRIVAAIQEQNDAISASTLITIARLRQEAYRLATYDIGDIFDANDNVLPIHQMPEDVRRCIEGVEVETRTIPQGNQPPITVVTKKYKIAKKTSALVTIFDQLCGITARVELTGRNGAPLFQSKMDMKNVPTEKLEALIKLAELAQGADAKPVQQVKVTDAPPAEGAK